MRRLCGLLGLCMKAGKLVSGEEICVEKIRKRRAKLVLMDEAIAPNGRKAIENACKTANVPLRSLPKDVIGTSIGKPGRMCAALTDDGLAWKMLELIEQIEPNSGVH